MSCVLKSPEYESLLFSVTVFFKTINLRAFDVWNLLNQLNQYDQ